jgi:hypothetical protein
MDEVQLAEAMQRLADELMSAQPVGDDQLARNFDITSAEVELTLRAVPQTDGGARFVVAGGSATEATESNTHRLRLALTLRSSVGHGSQPLADGPENTSAADLSVVKTDKTGSIARYDRSGAIEPLSRELLRHRIADTFSGGYLTVIAIIQGVALGILLSTTQHQFSEKTTLASHLMVAGQGLATFAAIVIVTQQYLILAALVRWTPTALDTLIPYALGVGEIGAALLVGDVASWWTSFAVLLLVAIGAFAYSLLRGNANVFGDMPAIQKQYLSSLKLQILACAALAAVCITIGLLDFVGVRATWLYALAPIAVLTGGVLIEIAGNRDQDDVFVRSGIPWWSFRSAQEDGTAADSEGGASPKQPNAQATPADTSAGSETQA